jgi:hypothetical protein
MTCFEGFFWTNKLVQKWGVIICAPKKLYDENSMITNMSVGEKIAIKGC